MGSTGGFSVGSGAGFPAAVLLDLTLIGIGSGSPGLDKHNASANLPYNRPSTMSVTCIGAEMMNLSIWTIIDGMLFMRLNGNGNDGTPITPTI